MVVTIALISFFGDFLNYLLANLLWFGVCAAGYLVGGALYTALRVHDFASEASDAFEELVHKYLKEENLTQEAMLASPGKLLEMKGFIKRNSGYKSPAKRLRESDGKVWVRDHKARVMTWLMFWPLSLVRYLFEDLVRRLFEQIYRMIAGQLQRISDYATRDTRKYYQPVPPNNPPADTSSVPADEQVTFVGRKNTH